MTAGIRRHLGGQRKPLVLVPFDDLAQRLDDVQRTHPRVLQHGSRRVAQPEPANHDVQLATGQLGEAEPGQLHLRACEQARHEELVAQLHLVHVDLQRRLQPSPQAQLTHRGRSRVDQLETCTHALPLPGMAATTQYPGDVIGLVNATDLRVGDTLYDTEPVRFPRIPAFAPEVFTRVRPLDTGRTKQFRRGLAQLDEEGVIQLLHDPAIGEAAPLLGAVGQMQFEVFAHRLANEFGATVVLDPAGYSVARRTDSTSADALGSLGGVDVYARPDGALYALFESPYWLQRIETDHPHLTLDPVLTH
jgi:peptide subunit release factor RF-3